MKRTRSQHCVFLSIIIVIISMLMACASLVTDPVTELIIETEPSSAQVYLGTRLLGESPLQILLPSKAISKKKFRKFLIKKTGYIEAKVNLRPTQNNYIWGNLVFLPFISALPSSSIDYYADLTHVYADRSMVVELKPLIDESDQKGDQSVSSQPAKTLERDRRDREFERARQDKELADAREALQREREALRRERVSLKARQAELERAREALEKERKSMREPEYEYIEEIIEEELIEEELIESDPEQIESTKEKERRLLKKLKLREEKKKNKKKEKNRTPTDSKIPKIEVSPLGGSPSWGALSLSIYAYPKVQEEIALGGGPLIASLFIRLSAAQLGRGGRLPDIYTPALIERYLQFIDSIKANSGYFLSKHNGLDLYRALRRSSIFTVEPHAKFRR
jgi:hypothetical protein